MKRTLFLATALGCLAATPALAENESLPTPQSRAGSPTNFDEVLSRSERDAYRQAFAAIRGGDWETARSRIDSQPRSVLHPVALAELYLAAGSPRVEMEPLAALLSEAPDLLHADRVAAIAAERGMASRPYIPAVQTMRSAPGPSRRSRAQPISDSAARTLMAQIQPLIVDDSPSAAEALIASDGADLGSDALTEARQRVAWSYYLTGDDRNAQRLARQARQGYGDWAVQADWVDGLASWRARDCEQAADAFAAVGRRAPDTEMRAAGLYWAARAEMVCGRPQNVQANLRTAAQLQETFYGLVAAQTLGIAANVEANAILTPGWDTVRTEPNARRAIALMEIGERDLADQYVRHGVEIGNPHSHDAWLDLANQLNLPDAELWIARNLPIAHHPSAMDRFPSPDYQPIGGWRVDRSLVFAHALQESNFRPDAVSPAGARGLMQLMPGTAAALARRRGESYGGSELNRPEINIAYGMNYMEEMRDYSGTQGLLPKVIASYNAGPGAVANWEGRLRDRGDPLLYIESIPYWETRGYVPIVLRNYWMYQRNAGETTTSLSAIAQGMWPRYPGMTGPVAVRMSGHGGTRIAD